MTGHDTSLELQPTNRVRLSRGPASVAGSAIHGPCQLLENHHAGKTIQDAVRSLCRFYGVLVRCCRGSAGEAGPTMEAT